MKKAFAVTGLISVMIIFSSCEGGTTFIKSIDNRTTETIQVKLYTIYGSNDEVTINPNESRQIYWDDQIGFFVDESYNCTELIDSVEVNITNNKILTKNVMDSDNWERISEGGRNSKEDCQFIISNEDIQ